MAGATNDVVLLPGLDGTGRLFWRLVPALSARLQVQVIRYPQEPLGYRTLADYVMSEIGGRSAVILGESFSGPIAVDLAERFPDQIRGLILASTFLRSPWPPAMVHLAASIEPVRAARPLIDRVLKGWKQDLELVAEISKIISEMPAAVRAMRLNEIARVDVADQFFRLSCPVLALHGRSDWLVSSRPMQRAIALKAKAEMKLLAGPHMLLQRNPKNAANEIVSFVRRLGTNT